MKTNEDDNKWEIKRKVYIKNISHKNNWKQSEELMNARKQNLLSILEEYNTFTQ